MLQQRARLVTHAGRRPWLARMSTMATGSSGAPVCVLAILEQHKTFLRSLDDSVYTFHSPLVEGSVGQHTRHSLDHLRKPLALLEAQQHGSDENMVRYDIRDRHTPVEKDRLMAIAQIEQLEKTLRALPSGELARPSTPRSCCRRTAVLLRHHFPELNVPEGFGMAPSTANFNLTHDN
ncbi:hypothetical protein KRP22_010067 [Phytophthora ramorum]|nr:hypothetical protein KRP22_10240 [Phytophthora ramorum]